MITIATTLALAAVAAALVLHDVKPWRDRQVRLSPGTYTLTVTISADTSAFTEAIRSTGLSTAEATSWVGDWSRAAADFEHSWQQLNETLAATPEDIERLGHEIACLAETPPAPDPSDPTRKDQPHQ